MDEVDGVEVTGETMTAGMRLRAAREAAGMSLDDVATATRIPTRHLESLEESDFAKLPAPTYTLGFAKNYASAVGLNRTEIADQLRGELGSTRPQTFEVETYEPADPARAMPKWLILAALAGVALVVIGFTWLSNRELTAPDNVAAQEAETNAAVPAPVQPAAAPVVTLTATQPVWVDIKDGLITLKKGEMAVGESFVVPASAAAPTLSTGKPEALTIKVGDTVAPPVGPPAKTVSDVSLKGDDLLKPKADAPAAASATPTAATPAPPRAAPARTSRPARPAPPPPAASTPAPAASETAPATNTAQ